MYAWLMFSFKPYCERMKIQILKDDFTFIEKCLQRIPVPRQRKVMHEYTKIWLSEESQNLGRRKANDYLRELVE